jgi:hypothetical protein
MQENGNSATMAGFSESSVVSLFLLDEQKITKRIDISG